jgi:bifunctional non-homologous end joining protein LigD
MSSGEGRGARRGDRQAMEIEGRVVSFGNLDKVFWPATGFAKADLLRYLLAVAPALLAHLADRPLVVTRYPDGVEGTAFYQKNLPAHTPDWVAAYPYYSRHSDRVIRFPVCRDAATLAWLAQEGAIELHPWLSRVDRPDFPDFAVFDLDPSPPATFRDVVEVAGWVRDVLGKFGLTAYPKTSGATGLHLYVPIAARYSYPTVARWVGEVAGLIFRAFPGRTTRERTVARRRGVYIDHLQNVLGKTLVSVYSPRPQPAATVSTPVTWDELSFVDPLTFTLTTVPERLGRFGDLFAPVLAHSQSLDSALAAFGVDAARDVEGVGGTVGPGGAGGAGRGNRRMPRRVKV